MCMDTQPLDIDIGHVLTGNLNIIRYRKLRKLIQKGPSYSEKSSINWDIKVTGYRCVPCE